MGSTLIPPTHFEFAPVGRRARLYATLAEVAAAFAVLAPVEARVLAITGKRRRTLTAAERGELERRLSSTGHRVQDGHDD